MAFWNSSPEPPHARRSRQGWGPENAQRPWASDEDKPPSERTWGETALRILPVVGGVLDTYDLVTKEGFWRTFRDHPILTTFRLGVNALDFTPAVGFKAAAKAAWGLGARKGLKEFAHHMFLGTAPRFWQGTYHNKAARKLYRDEALAAGAIGQIRSKGVLTTMLQPGRLIRTKTWKKFYGEQDVPELPVDPKTGEQIKETSREGKSILEHGGGRVSIWRTMFRETNPETGKQTGEIGRYASFLTRDGKGGVAILEKMDEASGIGMGQYKGTLSIGHETLQLGIYDSLDDVQTVIAALPHSVSAQEHVAKMTAIFKRDGTISHIGDEGVKLINEARKTLAGLGNSKEALAKYDDMLELALGPDQVKRFTTNPVLTDLHDVKNLKVFVTAIEKAEPQGTRIARKHLRDYKTELSAFMDRMTDWEYKGGIFKGWLTDAGETIRPVGRRAELLDRQIREAALAEEAVEDALYELTTEATEGLSALGIAGGDTKRLRMLESNLDAAKANLGILRANEEYAQAFQVVDELEEMFMSIGMQLKAIVPQLRDLTLRKKYFTHLLKDPTKHQPANPLESLIGVLVKHKSSADLQNMLGPGRGVFAFIRRNMPGRQAGPDKLEDSAWDAIQAYMGAAIRAKHVEPATVRINSLLREVGGVIGKAMPGEQVDEAAGGFFPPSAGKGTQKVIDEEFRLYKQRWGALLDIRYVLQGDGGEYGDIFHEMFKDVLNEMWVSGMFARTMKHVRKATGRPPVAEEASVRKVHRTSGEIVEKATQPSLSNRDAIHYAGLVSRQLYQGLLFGRLPTALAQFTQFVNTLGDLGGVSTLRGIRVIAGESMRAEHLAVGAKKSVDRPSLYGAAAGALAGGVFLGPVGLAVGAAVTPVSRFVSGAVKSSIPEHVKASIGITSTSRMLRGPEYVNMTSGLFHMLEEIGFAALDTAESILRGATLMAGLDSAHRLGYETEKALDFAIDVVEGTQFTYDQMARNPWFRHNIFGIVAAPLTSFPLKQAGYLKRIITEGAADGAPPATAMARYLFWNGLLATVLRETTKAATGEELIMRPLQGRMEVAYLRPWLPYGVDAPEGFESVASLSMGRAPGPQIATAFLSWTKQDIKNEEFLDQFVKSFVPFGLVVSDLYRAKERLASGEVRQTEGLVSGYKMGEGLGSLAPGGRTPSEYLRLGQTEEFSVSRGARGTKVRDTTKIREYGRIFGFVDPQEMRDMDQDRMARDFADRYANSDVIQKYEQIVRDPNLNVQGRMMAIQELASTEDGKRKMALGGIRVSELTNYDFTRLKRSFQDLNVPFRNLVRGALLRGDAQAKGRAVEMGMTEHEFEFWKRVLARLIREEKQGRGPRYARA